MNIGGTDIVRKSETTFRCHQISSCETLCSKHGNVLEKTNNFDVTFNDLYQKHFPYCVCARQIILVKLLKWTHTHTNVYWLPWKFRFTACNYKMVAFCIRWFVNSECNNNAIGFCTNCTNLWVRTWKPVVCVFFSTLQSRKKCRKCCKETRGRYGCQKRLDAPYLAFVSHTCTANWMQVDATFVHGIYCML